MTRILLIEDDYILADEWINALHKTGQYHVTYAQSASEAEQNVDFKSIDVFIVDLFYKKGKYLVRNEGGISLLSPIRRTNLNAKIIVVTGMHLDHGSGLTTEDIVKNLGANHYLKKPFEIEALIDAIEISTQEKLQS